MAEVIFEDGNINAALYPASKEAGRDLANKWFEESQRILADAAAETNLDPIMKSGQPPAWDRGREAWIFGYSHAASIYPEFGTEPHTITPTNADVLAFEWPEAPADIREMFEETFPTVFFREVEHPGTEEIRYVRGGRERARRWAME